MGTAGGVPPPTLTTDFVLMACFHPLKAFRAVGGGVVFDAKKGGLRVDLPCGQCRGCRAERERQWALRCMHEAQMHEQNCFLTLTYDDKHLPKDGSLDVKHWQDFAKRLRKNVGAFRFFHCGEYGEQFYRPHYHACIFGMDFRRDRVLFKRSGENSLYISALLNATWEKGFCVIGELSYESAAYVARYCMKKVTGFNAQFYYTSVDAETGEVLPLKPPYCTMSRRPGVGAAWFDKFKGDLYPLDECVHKGRKFRPPRFYDKKLPEAELEKYQEKRRKRVALRREELTEERLLVREKVADSLTSLYTSRKL